MTKSKEELIAALLFFVDSIKDRNFDWVLVGSTNLIIQGIDIEVNDVDIVTTADDIKKIYKLFNKQGIQRPNYSTSKKYRSYFGKLMINNILFELMADLEYNINNKWIKSTSLDHKIIINYKGRRIPVNPLENEKDFYQSMQRKTDSLRIKLIQDKSLKESIGDIEK